MGHVQQADIAVAGQPHLSPQRPHGGFRRGHPAVRFPAQTQGVRCTFRTAVTGKEPAPCVSPFISDINGFPQQIGQARRLRRFQRAYFCENGSQIYTPPVTSPRSGQGGNRCYRPVKCAAVPLPARVCYGFQCGITVFINPHRYRQRQASAASSDSTQTGCAEENRVVVHP